MTSGSTSRTVVTALAALAVATGLAFWIYGGQKKREAQTATVARVTDCAVRLREALTIEAGPPPEDLAQAVARLDEDVATVDQALQEVRRVASSSNRALTDAADDYLLTAREILKRQADANRYRLQWANSFEALQAHMRRDNRTSAWVQGAVKAREQANRDFRGYSIAADVLANLLDSLAGSQKRIAPYIGAKALVTDDVIAAARKRVQDGSRQAAAQMAAFRQPGAFK